MDFAYTSPRLLAPSVSRSGDRYLLGLGLVLLGYTLMSRGFAYWGVPPLFIGEIMLIWGGLQLLRAGTAFRALAQPGMALLAVFFCLALARTVPYVERYGLDAFRDFMQVGYGLYALFVAALLVERPRRIAELVVRYRTYVVVVVAVIWLPYLWFKVGRPTIPPIPWAKNTQFVEAKGGDIMVQLAGITVFLMVGLMRARPLLLLALAANAGAIMVSNRGGMVAYFIACGVGFLLRPPGARPGKLAYAFALLLVVGALVGPVVTLKTQSRDVSVEQLWLNVQSIFGDTDAGNLEGTETWRMAWWTEIYEYTVHGPYFWDGRGFGINLAREDGYEVVPGLRSPHNGHMTILARMGVPGAALWVLLQVVWGLTVLGAWWRARRSGQARWMAVFAVLSTYWLAMHLNAAFDVYFEGPMGGIWFWTVYGLGLGAAWAHRHDPGALDLLDRGDAPASEALPAEGGAWAAPRVRGAGWHWGAEAGRVAVPRPRMPAASEGAEGVVP